MPTSLSFQDEAYIAIKQMVLNFTLKPGEKIDKTRLQELLGISNTPVREAIIRLQREGLFKVVPQSGTYVAKINLQKVYQAKFVRESVESLIMEKAFQAATAKDIRELKKMIQLQAIYLGSNDYEPFFQLDEQFHQYFYKITNNDYVWDWLQIINVHLNRLRYLRLRMMDTSWKEIIDQHREVVQLLENRTDQKMTTAMTNNSHILDTDIFKLVKEIPDYFD
ncbi:GntR family transcriptional regulator [Lapidilactobacillus luobeiensis]|uniref:GntR family transcriptional regulator n=1 Tax=Lapidilactobacillus luobeiensis TaxID=2950371 RepID=UPI0021C26C6C|nr:GntR family transcriptional regulator [Lapidilactobacillus luobeiensis]